MKEIWVRIEELLGALPRTALLALAVLAMRNPMAEEGFSRFNGYLRLPLQFVLLLLLALVLAAALRLALGHRSDGPGGKPLA